MDINRKSCYFSGGHLTNLPPFITYTSIVIRDSIRIAFIIAYLNYLKFLAGDVQNAYLNAPTKEKVSSTQEINGSRIKEGRLSLSEPFTI